MQPDLSALAAAVSRQALDLNLYAGSLQAALAGSLPPEYLQVERKRSLLRRGEQPITSVAVTLGEYRYVLERPDPTGPPRTSIAHHVGGVTLKTDQVPLAQWAHALAAALSALSAHNADAAAALARFTGYEI